jgi:3-oxoacyl-[acyl-carrier protein] reductase
MLKINQLNLDKENMNMTRPYRRVVVIEKKTVLVTGASRGIGKAIALAFAKNNYHVFVCVNNSSDELIDWLNEVYRTNTTGMIITPIRCDVSKPSDVAAMFKQIYEKVSTLNVLINNAGISHVGLLSDMSNEEWHNVINTNLSSVFYTCRAVIPDMVRQKSGKILNISSMWGSVGASCEVAYSASKAGVDGLTKALAKELAPSNISVNALALGVIDTQMNANLSDDEKATLANGIPVGRFGTPEEIADVVLNIVNSPAYMTGQIIGVNGGYI